MIITYRREDQIDWTKPTAEVVDRMFQLLPNLDLVHVRRGLITEFITPYFFVPEDVRDRLDELRYPGWRFIFSSRSIP